MPIFRSRDEMEAYERLFAEYTAGLRNIGINISGIRIGKSDSDKGNSVIYGAPGEAPAASIGNALIQRLDENSVRLLFFVRAS